MAARVPPLSSILLAEAALVADGAEAALAVLRAEHDKADDGRARSRLLSEMAAIHERRDDLAAAARDELAATNADPALVEPLESLIGIARRRRSQKNLNKLVERLARVAQSSAERQRAALELALQERRDEQLEAAKNTLERALADAPDDPAAWLLLEALAAQLQDPALRERALTGRAGVSNDPEWRSLLLLDCARLRKEAGDIDSSVALLRQANDEFSSLRALEQWEATALSGKLYGEAREAAEAAAALVQTALEQTARGADVSESSVPSVRRTTAQVATALLRAAEWARRDGDLTTSSTLLERASAASPDEPLIRAGHLLASSPEAADALLRAEIERQPSGPVAAALWLRLSDAAAERGDLTAANECNARALAASPDALRARALARRRLERPEHAAELVAALEREAEADGSERAQQLSFAAIVAALLVDDGGDEVRAVATERARALLDAARQAGAGAVSVAELGRALATHLGDRAWYEQATSELLPHVTEDERSDLLLELGRLRLLRRDVAAAEEVLGTDSASSLLATSLYCHAAPHVARADDASEAELRTDQAARFEAALRELEQARTSPNQGTSEELPRAILGAAFVSVQRQLSVGARATAQAKLRALHEEMPASTAVAAALADLAGDEDAAGASLVLARAADQQVDDSLAAAWYLRAAVISWRANQRSVAHGYVEKANQRVPAAARPWLSWALRMVAPNDIAKRRELLDTLEEDRGAFVALERAALEPAASPHRVLESVMRPEADDPALAWLLALSAPDPSDETNEGARTARERLAEGRAPLLGAFAALDYSRAHARRGTEPSSEGALEAAKTWFEQSQSLDAGLAWLTEGRALGRAQEEARARLELGRILSSTELRTSGVLLGALGGWLGGNALEPVFEDALAEDAPADAAPMHVPEPARWAKLELTAPGECSVERISALEGAAQPRTEAEASADDARSATLLALAAYNRLARGEHTEALAQLKDVAGRLPSDPLTWEGVRLAAAALGDTATEADACAELAKCVATGQTAAAFWERAGVLYQDALNDPERAEEAFSASLSRDYGRDTAFERLFRLVRARGDQARLLELVEGRLGVTEHPVRLAELLWEKARLSRRLNDRNGSLEALDALLALEPGHLGALALASEIHLTAERYDRAAELLARVAEHRDAPLEQRRLSALAAADLYETRLHQHARSLEILRALGSRLNDELELVERRALAATHAEQWPEAVQAFEELRDRTADPAQRASAAAFVLAIWRDKLGDAARARSAALTILRERADDPDALDLLLTSESEVTVDLGLLERARDACLAHLEEEALDEGRLRLLLRLSEALGDPARSLVALGALSALGVLNEPEQRHLDALRTASLGEPRAVLSHDDIELLASTPGAAHSRAARSLLERLTPALTSAFEPTLDALGVVPQHRIDPFSDDPVRAAVTPWATAVGLADFELYVGGKDDTGVATLSLALPTLVLGKSVKPPFDADARAAIFSALFALAQGTTVVANRSPEEGAALLALVARVAGDHSAPEDVVLAEEQVTRLERALEPELSRALPELWSAVRAELGDVTPIDFCADVCASVLSVGALATGEPSAALSGAPLEQPGAAAEESRALVMRRLFAFTLSPAFSRFRAALGMESP